MTGVIRYTILGCGSSGGVPRLGGHWGNCDPENPRNRRQRCSMLIEREGPQGLTRVLIDTTPDLRGQLLQAGVGELDAVLYTHAHADHVHGIDDLRQIVFNTRKRLPVWADGATQDALYSRFGYAFTQPEGSPYPPILEMHTIDGPVSIDGAGGRITAVPFRMNHGAIDALGFRIGGLAYMPDVIEMYPESWDVLAGLEILVIDALRYNPHPTHLHLEKTLDWIERIAPRRAVLTNMHIDMDYDTVAAETADHITPAHDGMVLSLPA
ncbi:MBL fold metallo-hydrolase [Rhodovulum adriaticum]|uniref:Phosphoribosyl 1,2-cyclic phosphate phosphodiesterase n=1 Tax=Rhodovulum adriaticum TaxID=35804 RepID=A0A4R2NWN8_RHOAD|nr:MBL fold metallo-hydrolase [Rhodovulum adriaticum]MBK1637185.1 phosphoribosyl 1,2-cyclic phosphodiesterase [Rhodovulum adriaticum]TCP26427.1 phosphoribosyl 1,2-cyclic phosphate phosphodiesterase [Rhodovulum adriaticum]